MKLSLHKKHLPLNAWHHIQLIWPLTAIIALLGLQLFFNFGSAIELAKVLISYHIPVAGPFAAVGLGAASSMGVAMTIILLILMDLTGAALTWYSFNFSHKFPRIDKFLKSTTRKNHKYFMKHPLLEEFSFLGVAVFSLMPAHAGSVGTAAISRVAGVKIWETQLGIILADVIWFGFVYSGITLFTTLF